MTTPAVSWGQVPAPTDRVHHHVWHLLGRAWHLVWVPLAAVAIGPLGPTYRTVMIAPAPAPVVVGVIGLLALAAIVRPSLAWTVRLAVAVISGILSIPFGGVVVGLWLCASVPLAGWVVAGVLPLPDRFEPRAGREAVLPAVALGLVATSRGSELFARAVPLGLVALSYVVVAVLSRHPGAVASATSKLVRFVERLVQVVLLTPLWLVAVLAPWVLYRLFRVDTLRAPVGPDGMVRLATSVTTPANLWARERAVDRLPLGQRFRRRLIAPLMILALLFGAAYVRLERSAPPGDVPTAMASSPWYPDYRKAMYWYENDGFNPLRFRRNTDITSPYVNVADGRRRTLAPPACDRCPKLRLWLYGGSTTFGFGQRDEHTIASELVRLAHEDGISLAVDNRGVAGDTAWAEVTRFGWDVDAEAPPDLAVFYDGVNDAGAGYRLNERGEGDSPEPLDLSLDDLDQNTAKLKGIFSRLKGISKPRSVHVTPGEDGPRLGTEALNDAILLRYERSRSLGRAAAAGAHVPLRWFWQPSLATNGVVLGEPETSPEQRAAALDLARKLPSDVGDLTRSLRHAGAPTFYDPSHTNELGARLVAEAMYARLRPQLRELASAAGGGS